MHYVYVHVRTIPTYRVYRLYDMYISVSMYCIPVYVFVCVSYYIRYVQMCS